MPSVISQIAEWGTKLPYWEQVALERIIAGQVFTDEDLNELLQYLLEDADLSEKKSTRRQLRLNEYIASAESASEGKPILRQIANLENINALVSNQKIEFGEHLTVLFGENGSGKSGYARVIASAAFTRGDKEILRDIRKPFDESNPLSADILLQVGESQVKPIHHIVGTACPEMHSFYVFDSTSVRAHLTKPNVMSFAPAGLDILTKLVEVTDRVRYKLLQGIEQIQKNNIYESLFVGDTEVSQEVKSLSAETDEDKIRRMGQLTDEELARIQEIDRQIAELKCADFQEQIEALDQTIDDLKMLGTTLETLSKELGDPVVSAILESLAEWREQNSIAAQLSLDVFGTDSLSTVGSPVWVEFVRTARRLAIIESTQHHYPQQGDKCLLCHQPLSSEAHDHLHKLWKMLEGDTQKNIVEIEGRVEAHQRALVEIDFDFFSEQTVSYRFLKGKHPSGFVQVQQFIGACKERQTQLLEIIFQKAASTVNILPANGITELWRLIGTLELEKEQLKNKQQSSEDDINRLGKDLLLLEHQKRLGSVLEDVLQFIRNEKWIRQASSNKVKGNSAHITKKYDALFSELVTNKYIELFRMTLSELHCPLDIEIVYKAAKGATYKQIALKTNENFPNEMAFPEKVLSEGEQRAVALADFFTEIALDEQSSGVVLDDPVTSLDFRWKETIAENVVKQASRLQVIVFTHDLHFLHCLKTKANENSVDIRAHWVQKRNELPGYVFIDNSPMSEKDFKTTTKATEFYEKAAAPSINAEEQQYFLESGFAALRTSYEAFIIYELFGGVVLRFEERISGDRLGKIYVDETVRDDVVESIGRISRYIGAHLHSDSQAAQKPPLEILDNEIAHFKVLRAKHKQIKKDHGITD
jgi:ABC-type molybdenum transport system ATPase subunit/photorepair protein PhrA